MKWLLILLISTNAYGIMSAKEARRTATKERVAREKQCQEDFQHEIDETIRVAIANGLAEGDTDCYTCHSGLPAFEHKLRKLGYEVHMKDNCPDKQKRLFIKW